MPRRNTATSATTNADSHRTRLWAACPWIALRHRDVVDDSSDTVGPPLTQRRPEAQLDAPIEGDGHEQQEPGDRLGPQRGEAQHVQRDVDRLQQQRAERCPYDAAAA